MQKIGRYAIEREIGRGEMGTVYLAVDPVLDRRVALKTVRIPDGLDAIEREEYLKRFYREAQAAGKLSHPGIVTIFDAGMDEGTQSHFIAMEYIAGVTLKEFLADGPRLAPRQAAFIAAGVAEALDYAHAHGVVHRDVKPANIILTDRGAVKLADFGIAKVPSSHLTSEGTYLGTPAYTSPEQVLGRPVDGRSDLFSLGIVLYELLSGRKPFPSDNLGQLFHAIAFDPHPPLGEVMPDCPPELAAVTDRALGKGDGDRYASGREMAGDLRSYLGEGPGAFPNPAGPPALEPGTVFETAASPAANPLADLIDYLEETTRRLAPKAGPAEAPAASGAPAPTAVRPGLRRRALDALASWFGQPWLVREIFSFPAALVLVLGLLLSAAMAAGALRAEARRQFPPGDPWPSIEPAASWRGPLQAARTALEAGRTEEALAGLQSIRLQRPDSPTLAWLINDALARLQRTLQADMDPPAQARRLLDLGQAASRRGDNLSATEFIQAAVSVEPTNPDAAAALALQMEAMPAPHPSAAPPEGARRLRLVFDSPAPRGYIMANVDGVQVLRKSFEFDGKGVAGEGAYGRLEEPLDLAHGRHRLQVWITVKNKESYTAYGVMEETFPAEGGTVTVRLDEADRKLVLSLSAQ